MTMSLSTAVIAQFKLILRKECMTGPQWDGGCVFHLATAVLGYFLIIVVALAQIPLLFKMLTHKQDKSFINPVSIGIMALMASNNVAYAVNKNLPISTWGEGVIQIALYLIIINLHLIHQGRHKQSVAFTLIYVTVMVGSLTPAIPTKLLIFLKLLNMPMDVVRKITLMYQCHKQGAPVSPVSSRRSIALLNFCSLGRFLTACVHTQDAVLISAYGQESLCTLALSTVAMVLRRRWKKRMLKAQCKLERPSSIMEECLEGYISNSSSGGEELVYGADGGEGGDEEERMRRRRKWRRKMKKILDEEGEEEEEDGEDNSSGSGVEDSGYFSESRRKRRKLRRNGRGRWNGVEELDGDMSGSFSSGVDDCVRNIFGSAGSASLKVS